VSRDPGKKTLINFDQTRSLLDRREVAEHILESLSDGLLLIDEDGDIVLANPAAAEILGVEMDHLARAGWAELFFDNPENADFNQVVVHVLQDDQTQANRQVRYFRPDGQVRDLVVTTIVMKNGVSPAQEVSAVLVVVGDVTEMVKLHRSESELLQRSQRLAQEKAEGLDRLARAVAHEIRNPITSIGGLAKRLLTSVNPYGREAQYLRRILDATERLETIVREVRDYADLPAPRPRPVDLGPWLAAQAENFRMEAAASKVELDVIGEVGQAGAAFARIDETMLERVLDMLFSNALDAMPGGGKLVIGLQLNGDLALITVTDSGKGVDPEELPYLFDPFYSTKADAVGMSLAIAKRVALEHHGDLSFESRSGQGATFTLQLPLCPHERDEQAEPVAESA